MTILDELLAKYPRFFYKEPDGNNYKHESVEAKEYVDFNAQKLLVKHAFDLDRPLQIWRNQYLPFQYEMRYRINLDDIKRVKLYLDGIDNVLLQDSRILKEETNQYEDIWNNGAKPNLYPPELWNFDYGYLPDGFFITSNPPSKYRFQEYIGKSCLKIDLISDIEPGWNGYVFELGLYSIDGDGGFIQNRKTPPLKQGREYINTVVFYNASDLNYYFRAQSTDNQGNYESIITSATIDGNPISVGDDGSFYIDISPGLHTITVNITTNSELTYYILDNTWMNQFEENVSATNELYLFSMQLEPIYADTMEMIPTQKYYVEVETYDEIILQKGFPHNDIPQGDIYDHNPALDIIGLRLGCPRRVYKTGLTELDYPYTYPPYYPYELECDYCYQKRMKQHMIDYQTLPYPSSELKKYFQVDSVIENRARYIVKMNKDVMVSDDDPNHDGKYMASDEWNSATYNVGVNLDEAPANIIISDEAVQSVLDKTFPISKKGFFTATITFPGPADPSIACAIGLVDNLIGFALNFPLDNIGFAESLSMDAVIPFEEVIGFVDVLSFGLPPFNTDIIGFADKVSLICNIPALIINSSNFRNGSIGTGLIIANNKLQVDTISKQTPSAYPTTVTNDVTVGSIGWQYLSRIEDDDGNAAYAVNSGSSCVSTNKIVGNGILNNIPSNADIIGVEVIVHYSNNTPASSGCVKNHYIEIHVGGTSYSTGAAFTAGGAWNGWVLGGADNTLGLSTDPDEYNEGCTVKYWANVAPGGYKVQVDSIHMIVFFEYNGGIYASSSITAPTDGSTWNNIVINSTIPAGCSITYDILKASDGSILLGNKTGPTIDISSLPLVDLEVRANITANGASTPTINSITVYSTKTYS